jgi:GlpG protein
MEAEYPKSSGSEMFIVGELRDQKMASEMEQELQKMGIEARFHYDEAKGTSFLTVTNEADVPKAVDYYRIKLGFQKPMEIDEEWVKIKTLPRGDFTYGVLIFCVVLFVISYTQMGEKLYDLFFIAKPETGFLYEVSRGQIWRLLTPIFLHLSILHILFNMLWFKDLGYLIEHRFGKDDLIILMIVSGVFSNLMQYFVSGPSFGGMSGVLYAMLGFVWVYKKIYTDFDYALPSRDIKIMIGWLFLCLTGFLGPIANTAHAGGLFVGMLYAVFKGQGGMPENGEPQISVVRPWGKTHFKYFLLATLFLAFTIGIEGLKLSGHYFIFNWF